MRAQARSDVAGSHGVLDRVGDEAVLRVPVGRAQVQDGGGRRIRRGEARAEQIGEQVVVAVPAPLLVQRHEEDVGLLETFEGVLAVDAPGQGVAQRAGQPIEHRRRHEERPIGIVQAREDLVGDVVEHVTMTRRERSDALGDVGPPDERQAGELEHGGPALRPRHEHGEVLGGKLDPHPRREERPGLIGREAKGLGPQFQQLTLRPEARQRKRGIFAGRDHEPSAGRQSLQEEPHRAADGGRRNDVVVVEDEHRRCRRLGEQQGDLVDDVTGLRRLSAPGGRRGRATRSPGRGRPEVAQEAGRVVVGPIEGEPRARDLRGREPVDERRRLAESGWGGDEHEPRVRRACEEIDEASSMDPPARQAGHRQLAREKKIRRSCHRSSS